MTTLKSLMMVSALLLGGTSLGMAQNGLPTGGQPPEAGDTPATPQRQALQQLFRLELLVITGHGTTECT